MDDAAFRIFISYRREDARGFAGWLAYSLQARFGEENIFRDVSGIESGVDFMRRITESLERAHVVLCLIGSEWTAAPHPDGSAAFKDPEDPIRVEVREALRRRIVIPILLEDAQMPIPGALPAEVAPLTGLQAHRMRDASWATDLDHLVARLEELRAQMSTPTLTGQEIVDRFRSGENRPTWIGRVGGPGGRAFTEDVGSGRWRQQRYEVQFGGAVRNRNWFSLRQFVDKVAPPTDPAGSG